MRIYHFSSIHILLSEDSLASSTVIIQEISKQDMTPLDLRTLINVIASGNSLYPH